MTTLRATLAAEVEAGRSEGARTDWGQVAAQQRASARGAARAMREYVQLVPEPMVGQLRFRDFPFQEEWFSDEIADAEEVVWRKATQVGMCLAPETRVLTAGLRWRAIDDVEPGEQLVAVDEVGPDRRMQTATVLGKVEREAAAVRLTLEDGSQVVTTAEHRWLHRRFDGRGWEWCAVGAMRVGDQIKRLVKPWGAATLEDGWFGGLLDGEGHMARQRSGANLLVSQHHGPVYDRAVAYARSRGVAFKESVSRPRGVGRIELSRMADVFMVLGLAQPTRWADRRWWAGKRLPSMWDEGAPRVVAIEPMPCQRVIDIETSEGTFIAEGLVSHNSAYAWRWAVRRTDQFGETVVYVFPTDKHVSEFGDERIEPAIEASEYLRSRILGRFVRNKHLKRIGRGFLHLRGSNSKAGAQSVAAQALVFDEYDFLDASNLPQIERRITGARQLGMRPRIRRLGTPTIDGYGISAAFDSSDRRVWMVACDGCGHEQQVTWEESVRWRNERDGPVMRPGHDVYDDPNRVVEAWRACRECDGQLDTRHGRWVAQNPGAAVIGFDVPRLIVPNTDLVQIIRASRRTKPQDVETFENNDLGRPYTATEAALNAAQIIAACGHGGGRVEGYVGPNPTTMGVDVAGERNLSVRVSEQLPPDAPGVANPRRALWIGEVDSFREVARLMEAFRVHVAVIDSNPERRMARTVQATFPGRVVLCEYDYRDDAPALELKEVGERGTVLEGVPLRVRVNRTEALDAMMDGIRQVRNRPLQDPPAKYVDQLRAPKRRTVIASNGRPRREYVSTGTVGDDFAHAEVYDLVATEILRMRGAVQSVQRPPEVVPDEEIGFRRIRLDRDTGDYRRGFE